MRLARVLILCLVLVNSQLAMLWDTAHATAVSSVVISQVQAGNKSSSRLVELYNNSDQPVDITGWCVRYVAETAPVALNGSTSMRVCFNPDLISQHIVLPAREHVLVGASQLGIVADFMMIEGLGTGLSGKVYIVDALQNIVDMFGWGAGTLGAEGTPKTSEGNVAKVYERKQSVTGTYIDTNDNNADFFDSKLRANYLIGALVEIDDVCQNLPDIQTLVPTGMVLDGEDMCINEPVDICVNIDGEQLTLGAGVEVDDEGNCYQDACLNLAGFQGTIPAGYKESTQEFDCYLDLLPVQVTELLPNPDGDDNHNEFIELYNPNDVAVDLTYHVFHLGGDYAKAYSFPIGFLIKPKGYIALYNNDISFTLTNAVSSLRLRSLDNTHVYDVQEYSNAGSGEAWALINGIWQYTNMPTPGAENIPSSTEQELMTTALLTDCGEGRERNPLTKRCRNIVSTTKSVPKPCRDDQYRSEETGRCRNMVLASTRKPCKDTQYRSEETGRCRNLSVSSVPAAGFAVQPTKDSGIAFVGWWALGGVVLLGVSYGVWEWRREIIEILGRLLRRS